MKRKLPPLNAVVSFDAAARHKSFKEAGDELCVTSSAISHQVRSLEEWFGLKLFERSTRSIELTDSGKQYMVEVSAMLNKLERFSNKLGKKRKGKIVITLQTSDSFASRWLIPRLAEFELLYPNIGIKIVTYDFREGLRSSEADLGILFIANNQQDVEAKNNAQMLLPEEIFPVCNPKITQGMDSISVSDLSNFTLIHDDNAGVTWEEWIAAATDGDDEPDIETQDGLHYNYAHLALKYAELGNGFTLANNALVSDALKEGRLAVPFKHKIVTGCGYYLVQSSIPDSTDNCRPFVEWLLSKC